MEEGGLNGITGFCASSVQRRRRSVKASWERFPANAILLGVIESTGASLAGEGTPAKSASVELLDMLRERRSIRRYSAEPVPRELVEELLDAATWAPSSHNRQPWRFCVLVDGTVRDSLANQMADAWRGDLLADGMLAEDVNIRVEIRRRRLTGALVVVVPCLSMEEMDHYPDQRRSDAERTMGVQSVALACQNLLLAAHAKGLGACWMCAALFVPELIRTTLNLPDAWQPQALITLGYPAESRVSTRQPVSAKTIWR